MLVFINYSLWGLHKLKGTTYTLRYLVNEAIVGAKVYLLGMPVCGFILRSYQN